MVKGNPQGAKLLREALERSDVSQAQLARVIGSLPQQISHILSGRRIPTLEQAVAIKLFLSVPVEAWIEPT